MTKKSKRPFRSATDINNYNQFLMELDKKSSVKPEEKETANDNTNNHFDKFNAFNTTGFNYTDNPAWEKLLNIIQKHKTTETPSALFEYVNKKKQEADASIKTTQPKEKITINAEINNINDLLDLIDNHPLTATKEYNINMETLHNIREPLTSLNHMVGMKNLKENIVDQILFYIQKLHINNSVNNNDFMHTVLYGPPGTGKTEIAKIIGAIFSKMGILTKGTFKKVTRTDLIAGYLGQTALKTRDVIKECLGGVLFIDEAYALGNIEKRDSFSKECIDTLCEALSDHKDNLMVIIAGYETDLNDCFFNYNQGLNSRFTWRFQINEYSAEDLYHIFLKKIHDCGWQLLDTEINVKWFEKHKLHFKSFGRDMETLFAKTKIAHSRRVFCLDDGLKKKITIRDLDKGMQMFLKNDEPSRREKEKFDKIISSMYV